MREIRKVSIPVLFMLLVVSLHAALSPTPAFSEEEAKAIYQKTCINCHGVEGRGDGLISASLPVKPKDWTDCDSLKGGADDTLFKTIKKGGAATGRSPTMPPWGDALSDGQIRNLVAFIRGHCKK